MTHHDNPQGTTPTDRPSWPCPVTPFLAAASIWLAAIYIVSRVDAMEIGLVGTTMLLVGAPISLAAICISSLRRQYWLSLFHKQGLLYYLLSRQVLKSLFWTTWALSMSFLLVLRFHVYSPLEWTVLAATIPTQTARILERIDDDYYEPGTLEKLARARAEVIARVSVAADRFRIEVNAAFDRLEDEAVNEYLDWYYSLPAEYGRIGMMLQGRLEQYLAEKVRETFQHSAWYHDVEAAFDAVLIEQENARAAYERAVGEILDENLVTPDQAAFDVALTASLNDIVQPAFHHDTIPVARRLATAGPGRPSRGASRSSSSRRSPPRSSGNKS